MSGGKAGLLAHLAQETTTVCRAWQVTRADGVTYGFTDHDRDLHLDGVTCKASSGMTAKALQQTTGLSVDNTEAAGALTDAGIAEADILAGRFDGAEVAIWTVNWMEPDERALMFRGSFGEITRSAGAFKVELRGLTDRLNQLQGAVFQAGCSARLGDGRCGVNLHLAAFSLQTSVVSVASDGSVLLADSGSQAEGWFDGGQMLVTAGPSAGLRAIVKHDKVAAGGRALELWSRFPAALGPGDAVRVVAGCDKQLATCRDKFANLMNFRGFPHIPGEDWLTSYPVRTRRNDGRSLNR